MPPKGQVTYEYNQDDTVGFGVYNTLALAPDVNKSRQSSIARLSKKFPLLICKIRAAKGVSTVNDGFFHQAAHEEIVALKKLKSKGKAGLDNSEISHVRIFLQSFPPDEIVHQSTKTWIAKEKNELFREAAFSNRTYNFNSLDSTVEDVVREMVPDTRENGSIMSTYRRLSNQIPEKHGIFLSDITRVNMRRFDFDPRDKSSIEKFVEFHENWKKKPVPPPWVNWEMEWRDVPSGEPELSSESDENHVFRGQDSSADVEAWGRENSEGYSYDAPQSRSGSSSIGRALGGGLPRGGSSSQGGRVGASGSAAGRTNRR